MRDYATLEQLVVLSNLESINAMLVRQGIEPGLCNSILLRPKNASNMSNLDDFGTHHNGCYASVPKSSKLLIFFAFLILTTNPIA